MFVATVIVSVALALMLTMSAAMFLTRNDRIVANMSAVGVSLEHLAPLAAIKLAGAVGLIIGLWIEPLGIAAAIGLIAYFVGAIVAHLRVGDTKGAGNPVLPLALTIAALALRAVSA